VTGRVSLSEQVILDLSERLVPEADRIAFAKILDQAFLKLYEGSVARYRLRRSDFLDWVCIRDGDCLRTKSGWPVKLPLMILPMKMGSHNAVLAILSSVSRSTLVSDDPASKACFRIILTSSSLAERSAFWKSQ